MSPARSLGPGGLARLALVALLLAVPAAPARGDLLGFDGTLRLAFGVLPPIVVSGAGVGEFFGPDPLGGAITRVEIPAGAFATTAILAPLAPLDPIVQFEVAGANGEIVLSAGQPPCASGHPLVSCAGTAALHGRGGLSGLLGVGVLGSFGNPLATLAVPLSPVGGANAATATQTALAATAQVIGGGWTTGRVGAVRTVQGAFVSSVAATGGATPAGAGPTVLNLVTPVVLRTSLLPSSSLPGIGRLTLAIRPTPEPGLAAAMLVASLLLALQGLARSRRKQSLRIRAGGGATPAALIALGIAFAPASADAAELITQTRNVSGTLDTVAVAPFDPSLGTLDRVVVELRGSLTGMAGLGGLSQSFYALTGELDVAGLAGRGFSFDSSAQFRMQGFAPSQPSPTGILVRFSFTEATDLLGFAIPFVGGPVFQPPTSVVGTRADFLALPVPGDPGIQFDLRGLPGVPLTPGLLVLGPPSFTGALTVQYVYTPPGPPAEPLTPAHVLVPILDATANETTRVVALAPQGSDPLVVFESGDVRLPVVIGGLWNDRDGGVVGVSEDDTYFDDVVTVWRIAAGTPRPVVNLGGLSGKPGAVAPSDVVFVGGSALLVADRGALEDDTPDGQVLRVEPASGAVFELTSGLLANPTALAADGNVVYVADCAASGVGTLYEMNPATGALIQRASGGGLAAALDLAVAPDGRVLWLNDAAPGEQAALLRVNPVDGAQETILTEIEDARSVVVRDPLGTLELPSVGVIAISADKVDANQDQVAQFIASFYVDDVSFDFAAGGEDVAGAGSAAVPPPTACNNGVDDDGDGDVDAADFGCAGDLDLSEEPDCQDGLDNDGDGTLDVGDPQCVSGITPSEVAPCADGLDGDADGMRDFPADPGCLSRLSPREDPECDDGVDDDGDGMVDADDPECLAPYHDLEGAPACANGLDDDGDGLIDYPDDPGCATAQSDEESPACDDGEDNDQDGTVDGDDPGCGAPSDTAEDPSCADGIDNEGDGTADLGLEGPRTCANDLFCTGTQFADCDGFCFGGPREGLPCVERTDCLVSCVDGLCEESAMPRPCGDSGDCDGAACNSNGFCVLDQRVPADPTCQELGVEVVANDGQGPPVAPPTGCGIGPGLVPILAPLLGLAVRRRAARG